MLFFHTPKLLLLYKEVNGWTSLLQLCDAENVEDMAEKMQHINYFIESEAELLAPSLLQACSSNDKKQVVLLQVCKDLSGRAVRHIVNEISFLCENNPQTFDNMMNKVEVSYLVSLAVYNSDVMLHIGHPETAQTTPHDKPDTNAYR